MCSRVPIGDDRACVADSHGPIELSVFNQLSIDNIVVINELELCVFSKPIGGRAIRVVPKPPEKQERNGSRRPSASVAFFPCEYDFGRMSTSPIVIGAFALSGRSDTPRFRTNWPLRRRVRPSAHAVELVRSGEFRCDRCAHDGHELSGAISLCADASPDALVASQMGTPVAPCSALPRTLSPTFTRSD
jgi:hypothetical protein